jgi:deazaflavin-dependent oxidoreductase (nitroreductase family)
MSFADRSWPVLRRLIGVHTQIYRATCGLIGHRFPGAPPMLLLDHVGAKSGTPRTTPLVYLEDGRDVVMVASKGGHPKHPAWFTTCARTPTRRCGSAASIERSTRVSPVPTSAAGCALRPSRPTAATAATSSARTARSRS